MIPLAQLEKIGRFFQKAQNQLLLLILYVFALGCGFFYLLLKTGRFWHSLIGLLLGHAIYSALFGLGYFLYGLAVFLTAPFFLFFSLYRYAQMKCLFKTLPTNQPAEVVIFLGYPDVFKFRGWQTLFYSLKEMETLVEYLTLKGQNFSFYPMASFEQVQTIMADQSVREVYFWGHGSTHGFELKTDEVFYYCEFSDSKYRKDFVHQVHCGTTFGKSLIRYVVPEENWKQCFFFPKSITGGSIIKKFRSKIEKLNSAKSTPPIPNPVNPANPV